MKRKMESDLTRLSNENEELISEFRAADERAKKAVTDVSLALILQKHSALIQLPGLIKGIFLFFRVFLPGNSHGWRTASGAGSLYTSGEDKEEQRADDQRAAAQSRRGRRACAEGWQTYHPKTGSQGEAEIATFIKVYIMGQNIFRQLIFTSICVYKF